MSANDVIFCEQPGVQVQAPTVYAFECLHGPWAEKLARYCRHATRYTTYSKIRRGRHGLGLCVPILQSIAKFGPVRVEMNIKTCYLDRLLESNIIGRPSWVLQLLR